MGRAGVGERDRAVGSRGFPGEQNGQGSPDNLAAAHHDRMLAGGGNFPKAKDFQNPSGGAGQKPRGIIEKKLPKIHGVEAIDILGGRDPGIDDVVGQAFRQGGLNENAVNLGVGIEGIDFPEEGREGGVFREHQGPTVDADFPRALFLAGNVGSGGGIFSHPDKDQPGGYALLTEGLHPLRGLLMNLGGESFPIKKVGGHWPRMPWSQ